MNPLKYKGNSYLKPIFKEQETVFFWVKIPYEMDIFWVNFF